MFVCLVCLCLFDSPQVTKKLAGTAAWATNVVNEYGQALITVLTDSEGEGLLDMAAGLQQRYGQVLITVLTDSEGEGLLDMAAGLQQRYSKSGVAPPKLLSVDRDCHALMGKGKTAAMFSQWDELIVRLDVWHLIRRLARGVTTESSGSDHRELCSLFVAALLLHVGVVCR